MNDTEIIRELRRLADDAVGQRLFLETIWNKNSERVVRSLNEYKYVFDLHGLDRIPSDEFIQIFLEKCYENARFVADVGGVREVEAADTSRRLFVCWHFYEYPLMCRALLRRSVLTLIARDSVVFDEWREQGLTLNFFRDGMSSKLGHWLKVGNPILAMFDFCYPHSRSIYSNFFGLQTRTPIGIISLCKKFGYTIEVMAPRNNRIISIRTISPDADSKSIVNSINETIESEIFKRPAEWLMWPGLRERWKS